MREELSIERSTLENMREELSIYQHQRIWEKNYRSALENIREELSIDRSTLREYERRTIDLSTSENMREELSIGIREYKRRTIYRSIGIREY